MCFEGCLPWIYSGLAGKMPGYIDLGLTRPPQALFPLDTLDAGCPQTKTAYPTVLKFRTNSPYLSGRTHKKMRPAGLHKHLAARQHRLFSDLHRRILEQLQHNVSAWRTDAKTREARAL